MTNYAGKDHTLKIIDQNAGTAPMSKINQQLPKAPSYPLLQAILQAQQLPILATYSYRDAARIFGCSIRSLQERIRRGQLRKRNLPGRAKFLSVDLEDFLQNSLTTRGLSDRE